MAVGITLAHKRFVPPAASNFPTLVGTNAENPTLTEKFTGNDARGLVFAFGSSPAVGDNVRCALKNAPASANYSIIARLRPTNLWHDFVIAGIVVSDGTKMITFGVTGGATNGYRFAVDKWNTATSFSASLIGSTASPSQDDTEWIRLDIVSGVPTDFFTSHSGKDWVKIFSNSAGVSGFLTYTKIGFGLLVNRNGGELPVASTPQHYLDVCYWSDPDIVPGV